MILSSNALSETLIIPKKKPEISTEKKVISELKSEILPLKKPSLDKKTEAKVQKEDKKKNTFEIDKAVVDQLNTKYLILSDNE